MDFPDMNSLKSAAECHQFRKPRKGESEDDYRAALADHVKPIDKIESYEIRFKVGWHEWTAQQKNQALLGF